MVISTASAPSCPCCAIPLQGEILKFIAEKALMRNAKKRVRVQSSGWAFGGRADSIASSMSHSTQHTQRSYFSTASKGSRLSKNRGSGDAPHLQEASAPVARCIMRYGIATGPVTAGVLQGKAPMFDIWGKTVNLASRLESTGQPGRIQVDVRPRMASAHEAVTRQKTE